jgi:hypothetical protein
MLFGAWAFIGRKSLKGYKMHKKKNQSMYTKHEKDSNIRKRANEWSQKINDRCLKIKEGRTIVVSDFHHWSQKNPDSTLREIGMVYHQLKKSGKNNSVLVDDY